MANLNNNSRSSSKDIYFSNNLEAPKMSQRQQNTLNKKPTTKKKPQKQNGVGSTYLFFIIVIVVSMVMSVYAIMCMNDVLAITKTKSSVTVSYTEQIENSNDAVNVLSDNGLIRCKNFCKFFVILRDSVIKSSRLGGPYEAGVYYLNGKMGLEGMLITMQGKTNSKETIHLTFPEGYTVPEIINKLADNDVCDKNSLLSVIQTTEFNYPLVSNLSASDSIPYRLEGFLFPDTYEFYIDESAGSTIKKFIENGDKKFSDEYRERAKSLGYTEYEVMTIASIIQKEAANTDQMKTISSVIHNRLKDKANFPTLGCQSTADYITNKVAPNLSSTTAHTADYYMTYYNTNNSSTVVGLPAGPICNPGTAAIKAALYPKKTDSLYFFHDTKGNMYTAKSYSEFKEKVNRYAPYLLA